MCSIIECFLSRAIFRGGDGMAGGWVGVGEGFDGLVRRWRRSAGRPNAAGGCGNATRANAILHRHLLYARTGAAQRTSSSVPAASDRYSRRFVQVIDIFFCFSINDMKILSTYSYIGSLNKKLILFKVVDLPKWNIIRLIFDRKSVRFNVGWL